MAKVAVQTFEVRLTARDIETTKKALESVGAAGEAALKKIEAAAKPASAGLKALDEASRQGQAALSRYAGGAGALGEILSSMGGKGLAAAAGIGASALALQKMVAATDALTRIDSRLRNVTGGTDAMAEAFSALQRVSLETRTSLENNVNTFARFQAVSRASGLSVQENTRLVDLLNKAMATNGATTQEIASVTLQFSQALASGRLQGEESRALFEAMGATMDKVANSMGKTQGELRELLSTGAVNASDFARALLRLGQDIDRDFSNIKATVADTFTSMASQLWTLNGAINDLTGVNKGLVLVFDAVARAAGAATEAIRAMNAEAKRAEGIPIPPQAPRFDAGGTLESQIPRRPVSETIKRSLGDLESGNNYNPRANGIAYGKYQFTPGRLQDLGADFGRYLKDPAYQEEVMDTHVTQLIAEGFKRGVLNERSTDAQISAWVHAAHLGGAQGAANYLASGGRYDPADKFGTRISRYYATGYTVGLTSSRGAGATGFVGPAPGSFRAAQEVGMEDAERAGRDALFERETRRRNAIALAPDGTPGRPALGSFRAAQEAGLDEMEGVREATAKEIQQQQDLQALHDRVWEDYARQIGDTIGLINRRRQAQLDEIDAFQMSEEERQSLIAITNDAYDAQIAKVRASTDETLDVTRELGLTMTSAFEDAVLSAQDYDNALQALSATLQGLLRDMTQILVRTQITEPLANWLVGGRDASGGGALGNVAGWVGGLFGGDAGWNAGAYAGADYGAQSGLFSLFAMHSGGLVGASGTHRLGHPEFFVDAPRFHRGGLVGGEVPIIAQMGEEVLTRADPRHRANGGGQPVINIIDQRRGDQPAIETRERRQGGQSIIDIIIPAVHEDLTRNGPLARAFSANFGLRPQTRR